MGGYLAYGAKKHKLGKSRELRYGFRFVVCVGVGHNIIPLVMLKVLGLFLGRSNRDTYPQTGQPFTVAGQQYIVGSVTDVFAAEVSS